MSEAGGKVPEALLREVTKGWNDQTSDMNLVRLAARLGMPVARERALVIAQSADTGVEARVKAIALLGELAEPSASAALLELVSTDQPPAIAAAALDALPGLADPALAGKLLERYPAFDTRLKSKCCDVLLARQAWAEALLTAVERGQVPAVDVTVDQLRVVALHGEAKLDALVKKHWGTIQGGTPEERLAEMRRINNDLRAGSGDLVAGRQLFLRQCGACHRLFGEGGSIGPELTHANRKKTDELLATIVNPSAVIRKEYMNFVLQSTDGRVLSGLLVEQTPSQVTLLSAKNERTTVGRDKIESLEESATSLMPENLLSGLKPQELRDLFSYLQSEPPMAAASR